MRSPGRQKQKETQADTGRELFQPDAQSDSYRILYFRDRLKDIGYVGNQPNQWNGVPDDVLKQYNLAYTEKELKECVSFDKA